MFHVSCRRFCNKIHKKGRHATLDQLTRKRLHHLHRLGRDEIHWTDDQLGLRKEEGVHSHARLFVSKGIATIRPPHAGKATELTAPDVTPNYGAKVQYSPEDDDSPPLNKEDTKYIQAVAGTLLYYGRAVDNTILTSLSAVATEQAKLTQKTMEVIKQLLDYCAAQEETIISHRASKMILAVHSDAGYCSKKNLRSRAGRHFFLTNDDNNPHNNGAILAIATIIKAVMSSAAEAELGALHLNTPEAVYLQQFLTKMGHPQP